MPIPTNPDHQMFDGIRERMRALGDYLRAVLRAVLQMVCKKRVRCVCIGVISTAPLLGEWIASRRLHYIRGYEL